MVPRALANHKNLRLTFRLAGNWLNPIGLLHSSERSIGEPPWDVRNVLYPSRSIPPDYRSWNFIPNRVTRARCAQVLQLLDPSQHHV